MSVNPTHKPQRNTPERETMLILRRARQSKRDALVGAYGRQFTPVQKTGWRSRVQAGEARKLA